MCSGTQFMREYCVLPRYSDRTFPISMAHNDWKLLWAHVETATLTAPRWFVILQMPYNQQNMAAHASLSGLAYDAKIKFCIDGCHVMPFCTTRPALPTMPGTGTPAHGMKMQHISEPNYILIANTEKAEVITEAANIVRDYQSCNDPDCEHKCSVRLSANGGYEVVREACKLHERPGLWTKEIIDACAAYLRSIYFRALLSNDPTWANLHAIICRFHDIKCHMQWLKDHGPFAGLREEDNQKTYC